MRKFLTTLLCLILVFTMMPMATGVAFANGESEVSYDLWIGGATVTSINTSGDGWRYVSASNTIILTSSFTDLKKENLMNSGSDYYFIYSSMSDLKIEVSNDITISASCTDVPIAIGGTGTGGNLNLTVGTNTNLNCSANVGLFLHDGELTNYGTINSTGITHGMQIVGGNLTNYGTITSIGNGTQTNGIYIKYGNLTNEGTITATSSGYTSAGMYIGYGEITNQGDITAMGDFGIYLYNATLTNQGDITAMGDFGITTGGGGQVINKENIIATGTSYGIWGVGLINSNNIIAQGGTCAILTQNLSNEGGNFEILASEEIENTPVSKEISELNASLTSYEYVKISPKESQPKPSYHGSSFDYELYMANLAKLEKEKHDNLVKEAKAVIKKTEFKATSTKQTKLNGKKAVKIKWEVVGGEYDLSDFDGFDIYRSAKKNSGYTKTPFFTTTKWTYTNNKDLKAGKTYYYKVRAWKMVDGEKVYTGWSTKAWRTVK